MDNPRLGILAMVLFLVVWNGIAYRMAVRGVSPFASGWESPRGTRTMGWLFLTVGIVFLGFTMFQLATGTFRWRAQEQTYSFADLLWGPPRDAQSN